MRISNLFVGILLGFCVLGTTSVFAQGGDQILDGIGETALIARYTFTRDANDRSRNNFNGSIHGSDFEFVNDSLFRRVLSLSIDGDAYISIPGEAVTGEESLSITGWIYLHSEKSGQIFFDFGKNSKSHFFVAPSGTEDKEGYQAHILVGSEKYVASSPAVEAKIWNHLAVVFNAPSKTLRTYVNGVLVSEAKNVEVELEQLFDNNSDNNKLYIGKSLAPDNTSLNARLFDFRIYRIPLTDQQIATIHNNRGRGGMRGSNRRQQPVPDLPKFPETT